MDAGPRRGSRHGRTDTRPPASGPQAAAQRALGTPCAPRYRRGHDPAPPVPRPAARLRARPGPRPGCRKRPCRRARRRRGASR
ncbi:hypothetical protein E2E27_00985 [Porphyrobacter sp. YT40]|nr:hypothetical protein E2E27_00985 [Porphyrobacter sp. YT40]